MLRKALITCGLISITIGCGGKKSSETSEMELKLFQQKKQKSC